MSTVNRLARIRVTRESIEDIKRYGLEMFPPKTVVMHVEQDWRSGEVFVYTVWHPSFPPVPQGNIVPEADCIHVRNDDGSLTVYFSPPKE